VVVDSWSVMQLGRERARGNSIGWSVLRLTSSCTHRLFIHSLSHYLECNIILEANIRIYMHIGTVCKGTVSPEFFYTMVDVSSLGFYSGPYYMYGINRIACKE